MNSKPLLIITLIVVLAGTGVCTYLLSKQPKLAYVKAQMLFNDFAMTKELKAQYENTINARNNQLDSLAAILRVTRDNGNSKLYAQIEREFYLKKEMFDEQNQSLTQKYDEQVWTRINEYVGQYSKKNNYDYLLGLNGDGSVLFGADKNDVTQELLEYMNTAYRGGVK